MERAQFNFTPPQRYKLRAYAFQLEQLVDWYGQVWAATYGRPYTPAQQTLIRALVLYTSGQPNDLFPLDRGLYIWGRCGTGKSTTMEALRQLVLTCFKDNWWRAYTCTDLAAVGSEAEFVTYLRFDGCAYYDDLGSEPAAIKIYGTELLPMLEIITKRYNLWQRGGTLTHFTSNYGPEYLKEHYGKRISDRVAEMCTAYELKGENLRFK
jgi:hypothetical protein